MLGGPEQIRLQLIELTKPLHGFLLLLEHARVLQRHSRVVGQGQKCALVGFGHASRRAEQQRSGDLPLEEHRDRQVVTVGQTTEGG